MTMNINMPPPEREESSSELSADSPVQISPVSENHDQPATDTSRPEESPEMVEPQQQKRTRRIRFSNEKKEIAIEPFYEYSDEEHKQVWYTSKESSLFEADSKNTIKAYKKSVFGLEELDLQKYSLRGLEDRISTRDYMQRRGLQLEYTRGVLLEQERQRKLGLNQPFGMHEHLGISTRWAVIRGLELASQDAQEASSSGPTNNSLRTQMPLRSHDRISSTANTRRMDSLTLLRRQGQRGNPRQQWGQPQQPSLGQRNAQWSGLSGNSLSRNSLSRSRTSGSSGDGGTGNASWGTPSGPSRKPKRDGFALMA